MDDLISFYKDNYRPAASTVTLTYIDHNKKRISLEINPWALASISTLFKSMPSPPSATYELNEKNWLQSTSQVECFLAMCRHSFEKRSSEFEQSDKKWNRSTLLGAGRLCDFMGIIARPVFEEAYISKKLGPWISEQDHVLRRVIYHRIAVVTDNAALLEELTANILARYVAKTKIPISSTLDQHNISTLAVLSLYTESNDYWNSASPSQITFALKHLKWRCGINEYRGIRIEISEVPVEVEELESGVVEA